MPGLIPLNQARGLYTQKLVTVYSDLLEARPTKFLRTWFPDLVTFTKLFSIEIERGYERVAIDVLRGTEGNRNKFSLSTEKIFETPFYREFFDITHLDLYERAFGAEGVDPRILASLLNRIGEKMSVLVDKIERAYELQAAQVLQTGIITTDQEGTINFQRKAESMVDAGEYWNTGTNSPYAQMEIAANFIRQKGKGGGGLYNVLLGSNALTQFFKNSTVTARADIRNFHLDDIQSVRRDAVGTGYHGRVSGGSYMFDLWTYPEFYDNAAGVSTPYIDANNMVVLPQTPVGKTVFTAVPQLIDEENPTGKFGSFIFGDFRDQRKSVHEYDVQSAGMVTPVKLDQIYTRKVAS